jgi:multisite-specific tRNA:(cytosine-C5)-methyltransferase
VQFNCKTYYPGSVVFEINMQRELLKKNQVLKKIRETINNSNDAGLLARQEIVSMLPPLLCDIQSHHSVFDMCAAPGSKTSQALEMIMSSHLQKKNSNEVAPAGFVVANDADSKRAFLLTHQLNRLNPSNIVVTNHNAQVFPELKDKDEKKFKFDRVMCDVPCASDAAIRKIPKKWSFWNPKSSHELHALQFKIVERGLQLLKVGGKLSYSTCSLNPIENEAVVALILQKFGKSVRLVQIEDLDGFKFTRGLKKWHLMPMSLKKNENTFTEYQSLEEVPELVQ